MHLIDLVTSFLLMMPGWMFAAAGIVYHVHRHDQEKQRMQRELHNAQEQLCRVYARPLLPPTVVVQPVIVPAAAPAPATIAPVATESLVPTSDGTKTDMRAVGGSATSVVVRG